MDKRCKLISALKAGDVEHLNGDLESHLKGTADILRHWGASELLQTAGLFHAAYGTAGFSQHMISLQQRDSIASVIGSEEEALVYLYCSCDRNFVFPQFGCDGLITFRDRFTQERFPLEIDKTLMFCELTAANELELVYANQAFRNEHGRGLFNLFQRMDDFLSTSAKAAYRHALSDLA